MNLYLDIETIPCEDAALKAEIASGITPPGNYKKAETIAEWEKTEKPKLVEEAIQRSGLDGGFGRVLCMGWAVDDGPVQISCEDEERLMLQLVTEELSVVLDRAPIIVGHNVAGFDLRFLWQRCVVNGVFPSGLFTFMQAKPWDKSIRDTMLMWHPQNKISLGKLCKILGITKDDSVEGSQVYQLFKAGELDKITAHCKSDVEAVRAIHRKLTFRKAA
jgi:predicted PolB exonuclease-like 3'-5' exonuclease